MIDLNIFLQVIISIGTIGATIIITHLLNKGKLSREVNLLSTQLNHEKEKSKSTEMQLQKSKQELLNREEIINKLKEIKQKYEKTNAILEKSAVVRTLLQPVIIMGPRSVGKTSLVVRLHAPWVHKKLKGTIDHSHSEVPIFDLIENDLTQHFANPDIKVKLHTHLVLDMHDFPGDLSAQAQIKQIILEQANEIKYRTNKNLGLVLICMFDSEEAVKGISENTYKYYNGDLYKNIKLFVTDNQVSIDRLILVFNRFDKLRESKSNLKDLELRDYCLKKFSTVFTDLNRICNPDKVCEIFTILGGDEVAAKGLGETLIKGECARKFVSFFVDDIKIKEIIPETATTYSSIYFL